MYTFCYLLAFKMENTIFKLVKVKLYKNLYNEKLSLPSIQDLLIPCPKATTVNYKLCFLPENSLCT